MSEELANNPAPVETPAIVEGSEVAPETKVEGTEPEAKEENKPEKKDGFQKAIDRQTRKYYQEKARADALEAIVKQQNSGASAPAPQNAELDRSKFDSEDAYLAALVDHRASEVVKNTLAQAKHAEKATEVKATWNKEVENLSRIHEDFHETLQDFLQSPYVTPAVDKFILESGSPAAVAHYLGQNMDLAEKIAGLSDFQAAIEIGKIQAKLATQVSAPKKVSAAPAPITPIGTKGGDVGVDPDKETPAQFAARRNKEIASRNKR